MQIFHLFFYKKITSIRKQNLSNNCMQCIVCYIYFLHSYSVFACILLVKRLVRMVLTRILFF